MQKLLKRTDGFTLIELIIVMVIIGILVLLLIPNLANQPKRARDTERKEELRTVQEALENYYADNAHYPDSADYAGLATHLVPSYIKQAMPADPKNSGTNVYTYTKEPAGCATTACNAYDLTAGLEYNKDKDYPTLTIEENQ